MKWVHGNIMSSLGIVHTLLQYSFSAHRSLYFVLSIGSIASLSRPLFPIPYIYSTLSVCLSVCLSAKITDPEVEMIGRKPLLHGHLQPGNRRLIGVDCWGPQERGFYNPAYHNHGFDVGDRLHGVPDLDGSSVNMSGENLDELSGFSVGNRFPGVLDESVSMLGLDGSSVNMSGGNLDGSALDVSGLEGMGAVSSGWIAGLEHVNDVSSSPTSRIYSSPPASSGPSEGSDSSNTSSAVSPRDSDESIDASRQTIGR